MNSTGHLEKPKNLIVDTKQISKQDKLDREQHYDIDGVTQISGVVVIPLSKKRPVKIPRDCCIMPQKPS